MIFLVGVAKFVLGEYEEATRRFEEYLSKFPGAEMAEEAQYRIALATLFGGKEIGYKKAIGLFQNYLGKFPNGSFVTDAEYRIAVCRMTAGEHEAVVKACDDWMRKHRGENIAGEVLALKGDALDAMGRKPEAALAYEESSDVATSEEVLSYSLFEAAKRYQDLGDWQRMEEMFRKFLRNRPDHPSEVAAYFYIGQAMNKQGKIQEAKEFVAGKIREFIEDPRKEAVERLLSQLAQMCVRKPRQPPGAEIPPAPMPEVAATGTDGVPVPTPVPVPRVKVDPTIEFEEILATFPDTPTAAARKLFARSELEMMRRKPLESAGYFAQIVETAKPEALSPILLGRVGDALLAKGEVEKAREMYDQIIGAFPKSEFADFGYVGRGELAMREKNWKEALKNFTIAADEIAASSKLRDATLGKARAMFELQQYDEAEKLFELVSSAKEWRGEATAVSLHYLGRIAQQRKDYAKAIAFFQRVYLTHQKYPAIVALAYLDSADCFKDLGKVQEARNTYAEMLRNEKLKAAKVPQLEEARKRMEQLGPA
jgi:TolA-binding protein